MTGSLIASTVAPHPVATIFAGKFDADIQSKHETRLELLAPTF